MLARLLSIAAVVVARFWRGQEACDSNKRSAESFRQPRWSLTMGVCLSGLFSSLIKRLNHALQEDMKELESWLNIKTWYERAEARKADNDG